MEENQTPATGARSHTFLASSIIIAALIVGGALVYTKGGSEGRARTLAEVGGGASPITQESGKSVPDIDDDVILGNPDAPVTLISFGDYQCPYCGKFFREVEGRMRDEYIKTGKVRMVYRDFPLDTPDAYGRVLHPYARKAAEAAECARAEGKYWLYHDALFNRQSEIPTLDVNALARELGLDGTAFDACVENETYKDEVQNDFEDGVAAGVRGTPANFINGKSYEGAYPYTDIKQAIEEALAESVR